MMSKPARILFVLGGSLEYGGAELHLYNLLPHLNHLGYELQIYCLRGRGALADSLVKQGIKVSSPPESMLNRSGFLGRGLRFLVSIISLGRIILKFKPKAIHFFLPGAYLLGASVAMFLGKKKLLMSRRGLNRYLTSNPRILAKEKVFHNKMVAVLGNSKAVVQELLEEGAESHRTGLIYNGIDLSRFEVMPNKHQVRNTLGLSQKSLVIICIANLWPYKGHKDLLEALDMMPKGVDWQLLLVGRDEGEKKLLMNIASENGFTDRIHFCGIQEDVRPYLAAADVAVNASHEEGFSNAVLEYLAAGLPCVVTDVGGNVEAVGDAGVAVPAKDPDGLGKALVSMLNQSTRQELKMHCKHQAQLFSLQRCVSSYDQLYRRILDGQSPFSLNEQHS